MGAQARASSPNTPIKAILTPFFSTISYSFTPYASNASLISACSSPISVQSTLQTSSAGSSSPLPAAVRSIFSNPLERKSNSWFPKVVASYPIAPISRSSDACVSYTVWNRLPIEKSPPSTSNVSGSFSLCLLIIVWILANPPMSTSSPRYTVWKLLIWECIS